MLNSLDGLINLKYIGGKLNIHTNQQLENISGLSSLYSINGELSFAGNNSLTSLTGIDNLNPSTITNLNITGNDQLSECDIQSICDYLTNQTGPVEIFGNNVGCNSQLQVEWTCLTSIEENTFQEAITIFPNPASTFITININGGYHNRRSHHLQPPRAKGAGGCAGKQHDGCFKAKAGDILPRSHYQ